tara:strand:+ start:71 stop:529 length:459 start_codon:yes stop_codon:yes gene_type:complete
MADMERTKENKGDDSANISHTPNYSNRTRLTLVEVQRRVDTCIDLRYKADKPILQREWLDHCLKHYDDKSKPQYLNYWVTAKEQYEEGWKGRLEGLLEPAMLELTSLLHSDNPLVKQKAIDQVYKMSGYDIQKHLVKATVENISIGFGEEQV